jgi:dolichol kinase
MRKELARQSVHLVYGIALTLFTYWNAWIGIAVSALMIIGVLTYHKREFVIIEWFMHRLERDEHIKGFGALTLTIGITSVVLIFPEAGLIAGIGVAIIDSFATISGVVFGDGRKHVIASLFGGLIFFIVATSVFSDVRTWHLAIATLVGSLTEFLSTRTMLVDDNITVPWVIVIVLAIL